VGNNTLTFTYDVDGRPVAVTYNGTTYFYATNIQGDVLAIMDADEYTVVAYTYDAWGNLFSLTGSMASTLGALNPLRYRSYVYDTETGFYYLQSRYYNPEIGRFLNADGFVTTGRGFTGNNMFAYCGNNPVLYYDPSGNLGVVATSALIVVAGGIVGGFLGAFSAATMGGNIFECALKGTLNGMIGSFCGLLPVPPLVAVGLSGFLGAGVDLGFQAASQYNNTGSFSWSEVDTGSIIKTGAQNALGTAIPKFGDGAQNAIDAFGTALIWAEGATLITGLDVIVTNTASNTHKTTSQSTTKQYAVVFQNGKKLVA